jgi:SAM-dependent methyltransferase
MKGLGGIIALAVVGVSYADDIQQYFASTLSYRARPVLDFIKRTDAWGDGRRDILDWGAGGGLLARSLAENGAKVVAVDMSDAAIKSAQSRLKPFPQATARGPRYLSQLRGIPGHVSFRSEFDVVVSYMGALSVGTTSERRLSPPWAMLYAARACRQGGSVIIAEFPSSYDGSLSDIIFGAYIGSLVASKWKQPITRKLSNFAILSSLYYATRCCLGFKGGSHDFATRKAEMESAGLTNVRLSRRILFRPYQPLAGSAESRYKTAMTNLRMHPMTLNIYEGTKKGA